jgi:hypothetical protein
MNRETGWIDESAVARRPHRQKQDKMIISAQSKAFFARLGRLRTLRLIFATAALAASISVSDNANARAVRLMATYDGTWNVVFATRAGHCNSTNSFPFGVTGGRVSSAGGGNVSGGVSPTGRVSVRVSMGQSVASGSGRLVGNSGAGRWSGIISGDRCSGSWRAARG